MTVSLYVLVSRWNICHRLEMENITFYKNTRMAKITGLKNEKKKKVRSLLKAIYLLGVFLYQKFNFVFVTGVCLLLLLAQTILVQIWLTVDSSLINHLDLSL